MKYRPDLGELPDNDQLDADQTAFEWFAEAHPHEAYEQQPDRFWDYFRSKHPTISREQMVKLLAETY